MKVLGLALILVLVSGCAWLEKVAPSQTNEQGNVIPGTHQLNELATDVTGAIPYGPFASGLLLLVWNFYERARANKTTAGLMATVQAIEAAGNDPETKEAIAKLKEQLSTAHSAVDVQPLINRLLSKIKFGV